MDRRSFLLAAAAYPPLAVVIAACGDRTIESGGTTTPSTTVPASSSVGYPTGPDDVVVRVASVGGFVPAGTAFVEVPTLLITGDGRLFKPGVQTMEFPGPLLPAMRSSPSVPLIVTLSPEQRRASRPRGVSPGDVDAPAGPSGANTARPKTRSESGRTAGTGGPYYPSYRAA